MQTKAFWKPLLIISGGAAQLAMVTLKNLGKNDWVVCRVSLTGIDEKIVIYSKSVDTKN